MDGRAVNAIIPPLALDGAAVSDSRFVATLKLEDLLELTALHAPEIG